MLERSDRIHSTRPDLPDRWAHAVNLCRFARALAIRGDNPTAAVLLSCFEAEKKQMGISEQWVTQMNDVTVAQIQKDLDEARFAEAWARGQTLTVDEAVALALSELKRDA